jgi:hypothetical protein
MNFTGQENSNTITYLVFRIKPCINSTNISLNDSLVCDSSEEIASVISGTQILVATLNTYLDQDQFDGSPLKQEISAMPYNYGNNVAFAEKLTLKRNHLTTHDYWFSNYFRS